MADDRYLTRRRCCVAALIATAGFTACGRATPPAPVSAIPQIAITGYVLNFVLAIAIYAVSRGDSQAAIHHMLAPDWSRFGWRGAMAGIAAVTAASQGIPDAMAASNTGLRRSRGITKRARKA